MPDPVSNQHVVLAKKTGESEPSRATEEFHSQQPTERLREITLSPNPRDREAIAAFLKSSSPLSSDASPETVRGLKILLNQSGALSSGSQLDENNPHIDEATKCAIKKFCQDTVVPDQEYRSHIGMAGGRGTFTTDYDVQNYLGGELRAHEASLRSAEFLAKHPECDQPLWRNIQKATDGRPVAEVLGLPPDERTQEPFRNAHVPLSAGEKFDATMRCVDGVVATVDDSLKSAWNGVRESFSQLRFPTSRKE